MIDHAKDHRLHVIKALLAGLEVPVEVLGDYPDLYEFYKMRDRLMAEEREAEEPA